jgi:hypothetical protein
VQRKVKTKAEGVTRKVSWRSSSWLTASVQVVGECVAARRRLFVAHRCEMGEVIAMLRKMQIGFADIAMLGRWEKVRSWAFEVVDEKAQRGMRRM